MIDLLGMYLKDPKHVEYPMQFKVELLNQAQERFLQDIKQNVIKEMHVTVTNQSLDSDGNYDLTGLSTTIWENATGIIMCEEYGDFGRPIDKISYDEYRKLKAQGSLNYVDPPVYLPNGDYITVYPHASGATINLTYTKEPNIMVLASDASNDTQCSLDDKRHRILVGLACEDFIDLSAPAAGAFRRALDAISRLNIKSMGSDSHKTGRTFSANEMAASGVVIDDEGAVGIMSSEDNAMVDDVYAGSGGWSAHQAVYISGENTALVANCDSQTEARVYGLTKTAVSQGLAGEVVTGGVFKNNSWGWSAPYNKPVFLSETTAGELTENPPTTVGKWICIVGYTKSSNEIIVAPARNVVTQVLA